MTKYTSDFDISGNRDGIICSFAPVHIFSPETEIAGCRYDRADASIFDLFDDTYMREKLEFLLKEHHPNITIRRVFLHDFVQDKYTQGTWLAFKAGASRIMEKVAAGVHAPLSDSKIKNVVLAGSDVSSGWAGWVDGALQSGYEAAATVSSYLAEAASSNSSLALSSKGVNCTENCIET